MDESTKSPHFSLQQLLKEKNLTKRSFARLIGRNADTVYSWGDDVPHWALLVLKSYDPDSDHDRLVYCEAMISGYRKEIDKLQERVLQLEKARWAVLSLTGPEA